MIESFLCALLRGESPSWPATEDPGFHARLRDCIAYHGVGPLLTRELLNTGPHEHHVLDSLCRARELKDDVAVELARKYELVRVLESLAQSGIAPLLLKGAALAYSLYPSPALRPRADTDLLIRASRSGGYSAGSCRARLRETERHQR